MEIRAYALEQASTLLRRLAFQVRRTAKLPDPDAVHDLRVAVRRFRQCLRVFRQFFPRREVRRVRRRLRRILSLAGHVRDRDIALELAGQAGLSPRTVLAVRLVEERKQVERELVDWLRRLGRQDFSRRWRKRLTL